MGGMPLQGKGSDLPDFPLSSVHLWLQEFYGDFPHHNDGSYLYKGVMDNTVLQSHWRLLAAQLAR